MAKQEWEQFESETEKQLSIFVKLPKFGAKAKHVLLDAFEKINDPTMDVMATFRLIRTSKNPREIAVAGMIAFLWEFEGSYATTIDAFCYLLVENGHDLFDVIHRNYAKSIEDISNVNISTKLQFLEEHNFEIFKRTEDKTLRDKIAHHDCVVDDSGQVFIKNRVINIEARFNELFAFTREVFNTFCKCVNEC